MQRCHHALPERHPRYARDKALGKAKNQATFERSDTDAPRDFPGPRPHLTPVLATHRDIPTPLPRADHPAQTDRGDHGAPASPDADVDDGVMHVQPTVSPGAAAPPFRAEPLCCGWPTGGGPVAPGKQVGDTPGSRRYRPWGDGRTLDDTVMA